ncbi:MAG TPA: transposase [Pyrinomonadaceae bacterium]|nr:transposase [Pyrinomonadaceae bacterium]
MWNDTDTPLAFFISFRCYGTWLHGDDRGSVDRHHNDYGAPRIPRNDTWKRIEGGLTKHPPVRLDGARRKAVKDAIRETCEKRNWYLWAMNVRTNHGHAVITAAGRNPDLVLNALKANATRKMRECGCWPHEYSPWAEKGSKRRLWNEQSIARAIDYVNNRQGDDLPDFGS